MTNNLSMISDNKREQVYACVQAISKYGFVKRLIVFGSAVTNDCKEDSDIDHCVDMTEPTRGLHTYQMTVDLSNACNHNCDILTYKKLHGKIKDEIDEKGVVVYELS